MKVITYALFGKKSRLQNSPYFCVFKYARAVKQKVWDWGERLKILIIANKFFLSPHTPYGHVRLLGHANLRSGPILAVLIHSL